MSINEYQRVCNLAAANRDEAAKFKAEVAEQAAEIAEQIDEMAFQDTARQKLLELTSSQAAEIVRLQHENEDWRLDIIYELQRFRAENARLKVEKRAAEAEAGKQICRNTELEADYSELLYQVQQKIPGETRHETAKRIIRQHEDHQGDNPQQAMEDS